MKIKFLLLLIILLQLCACQKRYAFLKKINVSQEDKREVVVKHKKISPIESLPLIQESTVYSAIEQTPKLESVSEMLGITIHKQNVNANTQIHKQQASQKNKTATQKIVPENPSYNYNEKGVLSFVFSILAIAGVLLISSLPLFGIPLAIIATILAIDYAQKALKELKITPQKGKWLAILGLIIGSLIVCGTFALLLVFVAFFSSHGVSNATVLTEFIIVTLGLFSLMMYSTFHVKKPKLVKPIKPKLAPITPTPDSWNKVAVATLIISVAALILTVLGTLVTFAATAPFFFLLALLLVLLALILGICALFQIKSTPQKGKLFAWIGILFIPILLLLFTPVLAILALLIGVIWWLIKRKKH